MCIRISIVLPKMYDTRKLSDIINKYGFCFKPINNQHILSQLSDDEEYLSATDDSCECYSGIGSYKAYSVDIDSCLVGFENENFFEMMKKEAQDKKTKYKEDAERWDNFLKTLINDFKVEKIGLLMHMYNDGIEHEQFLILDKVFLKISEVNVEVLMKIEPDKIYYFQSY